jgi:hypothetical protein
VDDGGRLTDNAFVTTRTFTMEKVEVQAISGYLQCGGIKGENLQVLAEVDGITRGGRDLFIWGLDGNIPPEEWNETMVGDRTWLDVMEAEIVTVTNSTFTC